MYAVTEGFRRYFSGVANTVSSWFTLEVGSVVESNTTTTSISLVDASQINITFDLSGYLDYSGNNTYVAPDNLPFSIEFVKVDKVVKEIKVTSPSGVPVEFFNQEEISTDGSSKKTTGVTVGPNTGVVNAGVTLQTEESTNSEGRTKESISSSVKLEITLPTSTNSNIYISGESGVSLSNPKNEE